MLQQDTRTPAQSKSGPRLRLWLGALAVFWITGVVSGLWVLWAYDNKPGTPATAPGHWPSGSALTLATEGSTLVFVAHPQCTCTQASLDELAEVLARAQTRPRTYVLFLKPSKSDAGWEQTDLWKRASSLPHVKVVRDDDGLEAKWFGVETSGQTFLYDQRGALIFSGGITASRGHAGDNAGQLSLVALLSDRQPARRSTSVFGCPLFATTE